MLICPTASGSTPNFHWSTTSRDVKDGKAEYITREPEQVKAFRNTWCESGHFYLTYLLDRLTVALDLLAESARSLRRSATRTCTGSEGF